MSLSRQGVVDIYDKLKAKAFSLYKRNEYLQSLDYIIYSAKWAYLLNFKYVDEDVEALLKQIADNSLQSINVSFNYLNRFVLLDTHGMDNKGLTQQYIRAFMSMGVEFLYISIDCIPSKCTGIIKELEEYSKAKVVLYEKDTMNYLEKTRSILSGIQSYQPSKIFLHLMPWDVTSLMVVHLTNGALIYNINLTDHAFWLGATFIDYNFEFRAYGKTVSVEKRNLKQNQLLYLPFYPVISKDKVHFQGFPPQTKNKTIIFTGGAFYKMFGNGDLFFSIIDLLLDLSFDSIVLIAGSGNEKLLKKKLLKLKHVDRILLIGNRKDINQVFEACDIYLDTYPIRGGLMEQYASLNRKPILAFSDFQFWGNSQKNMLQNFGNGVCGYNDMNRFLDYASRLLNDIQYRITEGNKNRLLVPSVTDFNKRFQQLVITHINTYEWNNIVVDYKRIEDLYLEVENLHTGAASRELIKSLGVNVFIYFPKYAYHFITELIKVIGIKLNHK